MKTVGPIAIKVVPLVEYDITFITGQKRVVRTIGEVIHMLEEHIDRAEDQLNYAKNQIATIPNTLETLKLELKQFQEYKEKHGVE